MRGLLAFLDPLLGRAALAIEAHCRSTGEGEIRDDESDAREQLARKIGDILPLFDLSCGECSCRRGRTSRPPAQRWRLVSDHVSIRVGRTSRRHRFPKLYASTLSCKRTSFARKR